MNYKGHHRNRVAINPRNHSRARGKKDHNKGKGHNKDLSRVHHRVSDHRSRVAGSRVSALPRVSLHSSAGLKVVVENHRSLSSRAINPEVESHSNLYSLETGREVEGHNTNLTGRPKKMIRKNRKVGRDRLH